MKCDICNELETGWANSCCNVCVAKMAAIIECDSLEKAEELVKSFLKYPTSKSALIESK